MSLRFDTSKIKDYYENFPTVGEPGNEQFSGVTQSLCFFLMFCELTRITEKNWKDVYRRVDAWQRLSGHVFSEAKDGKLVPVVITAKDVYLHIGFSVNVTDGTITAFRKRLFDLANESSNRDIREFEGTING